MAWKALFFGIRARVERLILRREKWGRASAMLALTKD